MVVFIIDETERNYIWPSDQEQKSFNGLDTLHA